MAGKDDYGTTGSVPDQVSVNGTGAGMLSARATPEAFGSGIGEAISAASSQAQQTVQKYQGMVNETLATNADANLAEQIGAIKGKFKSMTGLEAVNAQQETIAQMNQAFQQQRSKLPPMAAQGFDSMAKRSLGYALGEVNEYGASQIKSANVLSHGQNAMMSALAPKDPSVAASDEQFNNKLGDIKWSSASMLDPDHPGLDKDPKTGMVNGFKDNQEGQTLKSIHQNTIDNYTGIAWSNRFDTLAAQNPIAAQDKFDEEKWRIPPVAAADIQSKLEPQVTYAKGQQSSQFMIVKAAQDHAQILTNPPKTDIADAIFNQESGGNVNSPTSDKGAVGGMQIIPTTFAQYAKPGEDINNPADNVAVGKRILDDMKERFPNDPARQAVGYFSGPGNVSPPGSETPWIRDFSDGHKLTSDYVSDVTARMGQPKKSYATNADGSKFTDADYLATHKEQLLDGAVANAERLYPGDMAAATKARELMNQHIENAVQTQAANYRHDNMDIMKAISGDLSNGKPPATENELRQLPGMADLLKRVPAQDPKFYESIPTLLAKAQKSDDKVNSPNAYETMLRVLTPASPTGANNRISSQDQLDKLMGRSDGTGINFKDYSDSKKALNYSDSWKASLLENMQSIEKAGGNVDGKGSQRAMQFYNLANQIKDSNPEADTSKELEYIAKNKENLAPMFMPSRAQQLANRAGQVRVAEEVTSPSQKLPTFSSPDDPEFSKLTPGSSFMTLEGRTLVKK